MTELSFDEIKKKLWEIVDNKKTKDRDKIKALKQLANITVEIARTYSYFGGYA